MVDDNRLAPPNPWVPMSNPLAIKHLGKLGEESNELGAAIFRCLIQGINESEPVTGKPNVEWLEDEIADVQANIGLVVKHFGLHTERMRVRTARKTTLLRAWHAMLTENPAAKMQDAAENLLIALGMGWDLAGVIQGLRDTLPAHSPLKSRREAVDAP